MSLSGMEAFVGGALAGGLDKYGQIQDEQRKFKIDEMKAQAQANRELNLKRAMKGMDAAGINKETGQEVSKEDYALLSPEDQAKVMGPLAVKEQEIDMQNALKASPWIDPTTKQQLTWGELKKRGSTEGLISENQYKEGLQASQNAAIMDRQEAAARRAESKAADREAAAEKKAEAKTEAAIEKELTTRRSGLLSQTTKIAEGYRKDPDAYTLPDGTVPSLKTVQSSTLVSGLLEQEKVLPREMYQKMVSDSQELKKANKIATLASATVASGRRLTAGQIKDITGSEDTSIYNEALDYLKYTNQLGTEKVGGFLGFGQTDREVIRR